MPVFKCSNGKWRIGNGPCVYKTKEKADKAYKAYLAKNPGKKEMKNRQTYECECPSCNYKMSSDSHCRDIKCPKCGTTMRRASRPGPGKELEGGGRALTHNSKLASREPRWSSIDKTKLPRNAHADMGEAGKKSTWKYPHHWVSGGRVGKDGVYQSGTMYLHRGGLISAWQAAMGAHTGKKASQAVIKHLQAHRKAINLDKSMEARRLGFLEREKREQGAEKMKKKSVSVPIIPEPKFPSAEDVLSFTRINTEIVPGKGRSGDAIETRELELINRIAPNELRKEDIYVFEMWISNSLPDAYYTRMAPDSLRNYVEDLNAGRALLLSHGGGGLFSSGGAMSMPIGSSYSGSLTARSGKEGEWVLGQYYIVRGVQTGLGNMSTDDVIKQIEAGVYRRGSIGFTIQPVEGRSRGKYICSICGNNLLSNACSHLPGLIYEDDDGNKQLCIADIHGAGMRESSLVTMNAAQGTIVEKARGMIERGELGEKEILALQYEYGVRFVQPDAKNSRREDDGDGKEKKPPAGRAAGKQFKSKKEENPMELELIRNALRSFYTQISDHVPGDSAKRLSAFEADVARAEDAKDVERILSDIGTLMVGEIVTSKEDRELLDIIPEELRSTEKITELLEAADHGRQYKKDLIDQALEEGVRAQGNDFDKEHWENYLGSQSDLKVIRDTIDSFRKMADAKLKAGRKTKDGEEPPEGDEHPGEMELSTGLPPEAFKV